MNIDSSVVWVVLGFALLVIEMFTLTFTLLFIALGCFVAGLISFFPNFSSSYSIQIAACAIFSIVGLMGFRKQLQSRMLKSITLKADIGKEILIDHNIQPHSTARITYQGTQWQATNLDADELKKGDRICIVGIDGNTLLIRKVF
jgi:membrane protein implicated in regulation of membrane protease activity